MIVEPPTSNYLIKFDIEPAKIYLMKIVDDMFNIIKEFQNIYFICYDNNLIELYILFRQNIIINQ